MRSTLRQTAIPALLALVASPLQAQHAAASHPVVQPLPGQQNTPLNAALARLGKDPRDVNALIDAGNAALAMGDVDAAVGFFSRADQVQPNSARVRAGLAGALVHSGNPYDAIPLFAEAEAAGGMDPKLNAERGLAYDLVGDSATAQKYYRLALAEAPSDEVTRRLGLSLAIAGDRASMETTLAPLLQRGDKAAIRVHAFALAILGRTEEAVLIAGQAMPPDLAQGIAPYLRYMPRLTHAQQASAANFGHFPRAAEIGRDDPRVQRFAPPVRLASADAALVPKGEPLGAKTADKRKPVRDGEAPAIAAASPRIAPPDLQPRREQSEVPVSPPPQPVATKPAVTIKPQAVASTTVPSAASVQTPTAVNAPKLAASSFDLGQVGKPTATSVSPASTPVASTPVAMAPASVPAPTSVSAPVKATPAAPAPAPKAESPRPASFADAFGDLGVPKLAAVPVSGAVDVRKITPARAAPPKPVYPSRIWVQIGVGRERGALGFTWRNMLKDSPELFRSKSPSTAEWGRTNRLLVGPFDTEAAAKAYLAKLKKAELDAFVWTSPAGQVVDPLNTK